MKIKRILDNGYIYKTLLTLCVALSSNLVFSQETITLGMPSYPPYTDIQEGKPTGFGYNLVDKIMASAGVSLTVVPMPNYGRAFQETRQGNVDGFFLASQNSARDEIAVFSEPVSSSEWTWVTLNCSTLPEFGTVEFKNQARVGVHLNSNIHRFLLAEGYTVASSPSDIEVLLKMLNVGRLNAIILPKLTLLDIIEKSGGSIGNYRTSVEKTFPFGIYFSKEYLAKNSETVARINSMIRSFVVKE